MRNPLVRRTRDFAFLDTVASQLKAPETYPNAVAVGDFNGDGIPDLIVADNGLDDGSQSGLSVLLGNGDGSFQAPVHIATSFRPVSVVAGDFDADGIPDLAVTTNSGAVGIFLGNGDGTFQAATSFFPGGPESSVPRPGSRAARPDSAG
jgi:hypothetical protein